MSADNSKETNNLVLRDAVIFYNLSKAFRLGIGQTKLPGNRQRVNSSGQLQFAERSTTHDAFTLDRDRGIFFQNDFHVGKVVQKLYYSEFGEGRILFLQTLVYVIQQEQNGYHLVNLKTVAIILRPTLSVNKNPKFLLEPHTVTTIKQSVLKGNLENIYTTMNL